MQLPTEIFDEFKFNFKKLFLRAESYANDVIEKVSELDARIMMFKDVPIEEYTEEDYVLIIHMLVKSDSKVFENSFSDARIKLMASFNWSAIHPLNQIYNIVWELKNLNQMNNKNITLLHNND